MKSKQKTCRSRLDKTKAILMDLLESIYATQTMPKIHAERIARDIRKLK